MPCYQIRTIAIEFKTGNVSILKKALTNLGFSFSERSYGLDVHTKSFVRVSIHRDSQKISTESRIPQTELANISNQIKRAYSLTVINDVAKKEKWFVKKLNEKQYAFQKY